MTDEREQIARIIDHEGYWERLDSCNHALETVQMNAHQRHALTAVRDDELRGTTESLAKADAILARSDPRAPVVSGEWVQEPRAPNVDPAGPTITHAQLCRLSKVFNAHDGTHDNDGFAINEWLKSRLAILSALAAAPSPPVADKPGAGEAVAWIPVDHRDGDPPPTSAETEVMVLRRDGRQDGPYRAGRIVWLHQHVASDPMFWRPFYQPSAAERLVRAAVRDADEVSSLIYAGGYRANLSDTERLRNHIRKLASALANATPPTGDGKPDRAVIRLARAAFEAAQTMPTIDGEDRCAKEELYAAVEPFRSALALPAGGEA